MGGAVGVGSAGDAIGGVAAAVTVTTGIDFSSRLPVKKSNSYDSSTYTLKFMKILPSVVAFENVLKTCKNDGYKTSTYRAL